MAQLGGNFDANSVQPRQDFEVLPPGAYPVMIVGSAMKPTKDNTGQRLELELDIIDGEFKGRKLWDGLNLVNNSPKAVEIAERTLSAICHAVGVLNVSDSEQLHHRPMLAKVKVKPADGTYSAKNEIGTYEPLTVAGIAPAARPAQPAPAADAPATPAYTPQAAVVASRPTAAAGSPPPWRK